MYLKEKDFGKAAESLKSFEKKDNTKVASTAATNLAFLYYLVSNVTICGVNRVNIKKLSYLYIHLACH